MPLGGISLRRGLGVRVVRTGELADAGGAYFPRALVDSRFLLANRNFAIVPRAAQRAGHLDVIAFLEALRVFGGLRKADNAVPIGAGDPLVLLPVFVGTLRGQGQNDKRVVAGLLGFRVAA